MISVRCSSRLLALATCNKNLLHQFTPLMIYLCNLLLEWLHFFSRMITFRIFTLCNLKDATVTITYCRSQKVKEALRAQMDVQWRLHKQVEVILISDCQLKYFCVGWDLVLASYLTRIWERTIQSCGFYVFRRSVTPYPSSIQPIMLTSLVISSGTSRCLADIQPIINIHIHFLDCSLACLACLVKKSLWSCLAFFFFQRGSSPNFITYAATKSTQRSKRGLTSPHRVNS